MCVIRLTLFINESIDDLFVSYVCNTEVDNECVFCSYEIKKVFLRTAVILHRLFSR